jgi:hypothetical protein
MADLMRPDGPPRDSIIVTRRTGERIALPLDEEFFLRIEDVVSDPACGFRDLVDFLTSAIRSAVGREEVAAHKRHVVEAATVAGVPCEPCLQYGAYLFVQVVGVHDHAPVPSTVP